MPDRPKRSSAKTSCREWAPRGCARRTPASSAARARYVDDIKLPGMLFGAIVRSPYAHARIKSIDKSQGAGGAGRGRGADRRRPEAGEAALDAHARRRRAGGAGRQEGLLPDAGSGDGARQRPLRAADGAERSRSTTRSCRPSSTRTSRWPPDAPIIREDIADKDNVGHGPRTHPNHIFTWEAGDKAATDAAFASAAVTVREEILNPRVHPCPLETCGCVASFDKVTGQLTVYMTSQAPHLVRTVRRDALRHSREQDPHRRRRHRRRLRQQGAGVSGLRRRDRRVDRHRRADQVDRVAHRQHLDHRLRARLPRRRRTRRRQGRPHQGAALHRARRPRRIQLARVGHQAAGGPVQHLHRLVRHPQGLLPRRRGLHQQGAGRRRLPLLAARDRGGLPDRAHDRRAGAEARHRQGRDPPPQLRQGRAVPVHDVARLDARQRQLPRRARQGAEGGRLRRPAPRAGRQSAPRAS